MWIRDIAVRKIQAEGSFIDLKGIGPVFNWQRDDLLMMYRTPFQKLPSAKRGILRKYMEAGIMPKAKLPYGLDIWDMDGKVMVLNIEWDDKGRVELVSFRRGDWEQKILAFKV